MTNPVVLTRKEVDRLRADPWKIFYGKPPLTKEVDMTEMINVAETEDD